MLFPCGGLAVLHWCGSILCGGCGFLTLKQGLDARGAESTFLEMVEILVVVLSCPFRSSNPAFGVFDRSPVRRATWAVSPPMEARMRTRMSLLVGSMAAAAL